MVPRIAVFSDTHDHYPPELPGLMQSADELWHLGDVCHPDTLDDFMALGVPIIQVRGNCDWDGRWPLTRTLTRAGHRFHLEHIPPRYVPPGAKIIVHGHTHVARDETDPRGVRWLNPGCISGPRAGFCSFAWLTLAEGRPPLWELVVL